MHEKYKDKNILFLNICVDTNEKKWKESLSKLNLHGVNLIAEGWTKHPVCQSYGVSSVPNYFLIDKEGKIVNNNAPSPSMKATLHKELDKLLK